MEGSSAFQFGRAAYRAGLLTRRQLIADGLANLMFRLRGASDENTHQLRNRISESLAGIRVRDMERLGADVLAGVLPRIYPQVLEIAYRHQDEGRRVYIVTAASQELAEMLAPCSRSTAGSARSSPRSSTACTPADPPGLFVYGATRRGRSSSWPRAGNRPGGVLRVLGLGLGPADAPARRPSGRGQSGSALVSAAREEGWEVLRFDRSGAG